MSRCKWYIERKIREIISVISITGFRREKKNHTQSLLGFPSPNILVPLFFLLLRCFPTQNTQQKISWCSHMCSSPHKHAHTYSLLPAICFLSYSQLLSLSHSSLGYCPFSFTGSYFVFLQAINALTMPIPLVLPLSQPLCSDPTSYVLVCIPYHPTQSTRQSRK